MTTTPTTSPHMPPPPPPGTNILTDHLAHQASISDLIREYPEASKYVILTTVFVICGKCILIVFQLKKEMLI